MLRFAKHRVGCTRTARLELVVPRYLPLAHARLDLSADRVVCLRDLSADLVVCRRDLSADLDFLLIKVIVDFRSAYATRMSERLLSESPKRPNHVMQRTADCPYA
jgi:hypothetical protein